jgi:ribosome biogenesis protein MAK21
MHLTCSAVSAINSTFFIFCCSSHEDQWLKKVRLKGTLSDRVAALTLLIQEAPLYRLDSLKRLLNMATKKGSREAVLATEALRDMFVNDLLPPDRRLRFFEQQPFPQDSSLRPEAETLLYWLLEDHIKILSVAHICFCVTPLQ